MGRRREQRVEISLPVKVWGIDRHGKPFVQSAHTTDITRHGGRLRDLFCLGKVGEVVRVQHGKEKANFKVTWIGHPGTSADGHVGVHCIEPDKYIWGVPLPDRALDPYILADEPLSFQEHPVGSVAAYHDVKSTRAIVAAALAHSRKSDDRPGKKRVHHRYACVGTVEVGPEGSTMPVWCNLSDISISGFYAETTSPLPASTRVYSVLKTPLGQIQGKGVVRTSHAGVGMGVTFIKLNDEDQDLLDQFLELLAEDIAQGRVPTPAPSKPSTFAAQATVPARLGPPAHDRSLLVAHNRPQTEAEKRGTAPDAEMVARLQQLEKDLAEMQLDLRSDFMDSRILREFKTRLKHVGQATWAVLQWMELQSQNRDPFHVLHKLNTERIRSASEISEQLAMDIDSGDIDLDLEGVDHLYEAVKDLHLRLARLLKRNQPI